MFAAWENSFAERGLVGHVRRGVSKVGTLMPVAKSAQSVARIRNRDRLRSARATTSRAAVSNFTSSRLLADPCRYGDPERHARDDGRTRTIRINNFWIDLQADQPCVRNREACKSHVQTGPARGPWGATGSGS
jgi:hypothetical protein